MLLQLEQSTGDIVYFRILFKLQMNDQLECALDLMRRLPPQQITKNLCDLVDLVFAEMF